MVGMNTLDCYKPYYNWVNQYVVYSLQPHFKVDSKKGDFLILVPKPRYGFGGALVLTVIYFQLKIGRCFIFFQLSIKLI